MAGTTHGARKAALTRKRNASERDLFIAKANESASSRGFVSGLNIELQRINEEYVPALKSWPGRMDTYTRMGNDAKIAAGLRANILPIISAVRWGVEGGEDDIRDHIAANLLRQGDPSLWCETSWTQRLLESLLCLQYGISMFGKTREIVDGKMIFRRLTYLHPKSLGGPLGPWEFDKSGTRLIAVHRAYKHPTGGQVFDERIPVDDVFPIVWWMSGENWEGVPAIRSMYRPWVEKDIAQKIQMIDLQNRGVGIPKAKTAPNDGPKAAETLWTIAKDLRGGDKSRAAIMLSDGQTLEFMTSTGSVLDSDPIIMGKNNEIAAALGTDFQQQGQTQSGSRATGSVLMVNYMQELDATRVILQDAWNHGSGYCRGPVEELVDETYGPQEEYPQIKGTCVSPSDQLDNVPNILDGIQKGGLTHDLAIENHVRKAYGVPAMTAEEFQKAKDVNKPIPNIGGRPDGVTPIDVEEPRDDEMGREFGLATKNSAEKKTVYSATRRTRSARSYGWLGSTAN